MNRFRSMMNKVFFQKSMQYQLFVTVLIINLVSLIIAGLLSYRVAADTIIREAKRNNGMLLQAMNRNVSAYLQEIYDQSEIFAALLNNYDDNGNETIDLNHDTAKLRADKYVSELVSSDDYVSVRVFLDDGTLISHAMNKKTYHHSYDSPEEQRWQFEMKNNYSDRLIYDVHVLEINGLYSFTASRAIFHPTTGERVGYISYDKSLSSLYFNFTEVEYRSGGIMQVAHRDNGDYLYHTNLAMIGQQIDERMLAHLNEIRADTFVEKMGGRNVIISYNTLINNNLSVIGMVPLAELTRDFVNLRLITIGVCCFAMLLVLILSYYLSIYLTGPIKRLNKLMARVERGKFDVKPEEMIHTNREIQQLNHSFQSMSSTINHLLTSQYETELRKKDAELKALLMQINPHFLYNTLEVINGIADYEGVEQISEITQSLSKMLRYNIDLSKEHVRIADEMDNIRNYVLILKSRFEDQLKVEWDVDERVNDDMIVKMVLQPLLENAIRHGVERKLGVGLIRISASKSDDVIEIRIQDNGVGFSPAKLQEFEQYKQVAVQSLFQMTSVKSLGLKNVYARLYLVFGEQLNFHIHSVEQEGTTIVIQFPAIKYEG